jgi:hypothetical protein
MKSDRPRRTRAGKLAVRRNLGSPGVGKGRLRSTKRERKLSARANLLQTSESAEHSADVLPGDIAEGSAPEGTRPKKRQARTAHGAVERHRTTPAKGAKRAADPSGGRASHSGPNGASGKNPGRQARPKKVNADAKKANAHAAGGAEGIHGSLQGRDAGRMVLKVLGPIGHPDQ